jgi:hypothetical protein
MDPAISRGVALAAAERLADLIDDSGRFVYRYDSVTGAVVEGYHTTRHASAIWFAALAARQLAQPRLLAPLERAMGWLAERHVHSLEQGRCLCVDDNGLVHLGGVALTTVAALELDRAAGTTRWRGLAKGLGRYLLSQRGPDGEFLHLRVLATGAAIDHHSPYSTGQALLALATLAEATGEAGFLEPALAAASKLAAAGYGVREQSHWMLYAIEALEALAPRPEHRAHGGRIAGAIIVYPIYRSEGASTPIACQSEALCAYLGMLARRPPIADGEDFPSPDMVRPELEANLEALLAYRAEDGAFIEGGGSREVQIDHIQHAGAAFLGHVKLFGRASILDAGSRAKSGRARPSGAKEPA